MKIRTSLRLKDYDYSQDGFYFITICVQNNKCLFGKIVNDEMVLNELGIIVEEEWYKTEQIRSNVKMDAFVVMPNHVHGIICIENNSNRSRGIACYAQKQKCEKKGIARYAPTTGSLSAIIRAFKSAVTKHVNEIYKKSGSSIWQRNYYEHIIRDERDLNRIREYIISNPAIWKKDEYYK